MGGVILCCPCDALGEQVERGDEVEVEDEDENEEEEEEDEEEDENVELEAAPPGESPEGRIKLEYPPIRSEKASSSATRRRGVHRGVEVGMG